MFSHWIFAATASAIACFSFVTAVPVKEGSTSSHYQYFNAVPSKALPLRHVAGPSRNRKNLAGKIVENEKRDDGSYTWGIASLNWQGQGKDLVTTITVDDEDFTVLVDTASSDTWIASDTFECISPTSLKPSQQSACKFGPLYHKTSATDLLPNSLNITYGSSQFVTGTMAKQTLTIAQLTVTQELGLVSQAIWRGDGIASGILGLAFPSITNAFSGGPTTASGSTQAPYSPFTTSLFARSIVNSYFSLALERPSGSGNGDAAGYLAFGSIPPVETVGGFAATPLIKSTTSFFNGTKVAPQYQFYSIKVEALVSPKLFPRGVGTEATKNVSLPQSFEAIVGSASNFLFLPTAIADKMNSLFEPPVVKSGGFYTIPCQARPPTIGVQISGAIFWIDGADLVLTQADGSCLSGIADGGNARYELGDVFLKNVVAVFDVGAGEMRFAARK